MVILASGVAIALNQISCEGSRCEATTKADLITGSNDQDLILALNGNDTIYANDGQQDLISCGPGKKDSVTYCLFQPGGLADPTSSPIPECEKATLITIFTP